MIDSAGFADLRGYLKRRIACARFRVGSTYYTVPLSGIDILLMVLSAPECPSPGWARLR